MSAKRKYSGNEFHSTGPAQEKDRRPYSVPGYGEAQTEECYQIYHWCIDLWRVPSISITIQDQCLIATCYVFRRFRRGAKIAGTTNDACGLLGQGNRELFKHCTSYCLLYFISKRHAYRNILTNTAAWVVKTCK